MVHVWDAVLAGRCSPLFLQPKSYIELIANTPNFLFRIWYPSIWSDFDKCLTGEHCSQGSCGLLLSNSSDDQHKLQSAASHM